MKFEINGTVSLSVTTEIEADTQSEAEENAETALIQAASHNPHSIMGVKEAEVDDVFEIKKG